MSSTGSTAFVGNVMTNTGAISNSISSQGNASVMQQLFPAANFTNEQMEKMMYLINNTQLHNNINGNGGTSTALVNHAMGFQHVSSDVKGMSLNPFSKLWVLDSGATDHITCSTAYFVSFYPLVKVCVKLPNQMTLPVTHKGMLYLNSFMILKDVLCVTDFKFNLVSQSKLALQNSCIVISDATYSEIQDLTSKKKIRSARWNQGLYVLDCSSPIFNHHRHALSYVSSLPVCNTVSKSDAYFQFDSNEVPKLLWHYRLGHPSFLKIPMLHNKHGDISVNKDCSCSVFLWQNNIDPLFLFVLLLLNNLLILYMLIFGVLVKYLPFMVLNTFFLLLMISANIL